MSLTKPSTSVTAAVTPVIPFEKYVYNKTAFSVFLASVKSIKSNEKIYFILINFLLIC